MMIRNDLSCIKFSGAIRLLCGLACLLVLSFGQPVQAGPRADVIAHENVDESYLTRGFLRSVFTLRVRAWPDGAPVRIFVLQDGHALHTAFCRDILGTYPYVLRRTWDRSTFAGIGLVPTRVPSVEEMRRLVSITPGAVGYIPAEDDSVNQNQLLLSFSAIAKEERP